MFSKEHGKKSEERLNLATPNAREGFYNEKDWTTWANYVDNTIQDLDEVEYLTNAKPGQILNRNGPGLDIEKQTFQQKRQSIRNMPSKIPKPGTPEQRKSFLPAVMPKGIPAKKSESGYQILPSRLEILNIKNPPDRSKSNSTVAKSSEDLREHYYAVKAKKEDALLDEASNSPRPQRMEARKTFSGLSINEAPTRTPPRKSLGTPLLGNNKSNKYNCDENLNLPPLDSPYMKPICTPIPRQDLTKRAVSMGRGRECEWRSDGRVSRTRNSTPRKSSGTPKVAGESGFSKSLIDDPELDVDYDNESVANATGSETPKLRRGKSFTQRSISTHNLFDGSPSPGSRKSCSARFPCSNAAHLMSSPRYALNEFLSQLASTDWETNIDGFRGIFQISCEHPEVIRRELPKVNAAGLKHLSNLRSQVSRAACCFFQQMLRIMGRAMERDMDKLAEKLLDKTVDTNKFIRDDAILALQAMIEHLAPNKTIVAIGLAGSKHHNTHVRSVTARMIELIICGIGAERSLAEIPEKLLPILAALLQEGNLDTRINAKRCIAHLILQPNFDSVLRRYISEETLHNLSKTLAAVRQNVTPRH